MIHVTLKDGSVKEFEAGVSVIDVAKSLGAGLAKSACAGRINNQNKLAVPDRLADLADQLLSVADHDLIAKVKP